MKTTKHAVAYEISISEYYEPEDEKDYSRSETIYRQLSKKPINLLKIIHAFNETLIDEEVNK